MLSNIFENSINWFFKNLFLFQKSVSGFRIFINDIIPFTNKNLTKKYVIKFYHNVKNGKNGNLALITYNLCVNDAPQVKKAARADSI